MADGGVDGGGVHDGRLEGGERAAGLGPGLRAGRAGVLALAGRQVAVVPQLLLQHRLLVGVAGVRAPRVVLPGSGSRCSISWWP